MEACIQSVGYSIEHESRLSLQLLNFSFVSYGDNNDWKIQLLNNVNFVVIVQH